MTRPLETPRGPDYGAAQPAGPATAGLNTPDIATMARRHLIQPWPSTDEIGDDLRTIMTAADGIYVYDEAGNRLIDGPAGMWCVNIGHRRREMADAIAEQITSLTYCSPWYSTSGPAALLAARIAAAAPGDLDHVFFTTGGSTAVETAVRFTQFYNNVLGRPGKKLILSRRDAYHGSTLVTAALGGRPRSGDWSDPMPGLVSMLSSPKPFGRAKGLSLEAFCDALVAEFETRVATIGADRIAAFIAEPVMASGGVIVPPEGYLPRIRALCRQHDILFIADEVVTAFGRLGHIFASEAVFGVVPDILCFAKGVTSGYVPLGGAVFSAALFDRLKAEGRAAMFAHGFTCSSHPVACAAALCNWDILEREGILDHVRALAPYFLDRLRELEALPLVGEVRGAGLMACVECVADTQRPGSYDVDLDIGRRIDRHAQRLGLLVRPLINMCVISPPLIIGREDVDRIVDILGQAIRLTQEELRREGVWNG